MKLVAAIITSLVIPEIGVEVAFKRLLQELIVFATHPNVLPPAA